jgi:hypothetical protein
LCNLYSVTKGQQAIRELAGAVRDTPNRYTAFWIRAIIRLERNSLRVIAPACKAGNHTAYLTA